MAETESTEAQTTISTVGADTDKEEEIMQPGIIIGAIVVYLVIGAIFSIGVESQPNSGSPTRWAAILEYSLLTVFWLPLVSAILMFVEGVIVLGFISTLQGDHG